MKDANKEIKGKGGMKAEEEQEAAARFLSPSVSLAISSRDGGEREGVLQVTVATASLSSVLFAHTNCVCFGRERNAAAPALPRRSGYFCRML